MGLPKTSDYIQIKIRMPKYSQESLVYFKSPNEDFKDIEVPCTFKIKIESQNLELGVFKTSAHIQIKISIPNPSEEPPAYMDVCCIFKIKKESKNSDQVWTKDQCPYPNQDQDTKPQ